MLLGDLTTVFLLGLSGTGHCLGMCGAFSLAVAAGADGAGTVFWRQLSYQLGKATSYVFLGVVLLLAMSWAGAQWPLLPLQTAVAWIAGTAMVAMGLAYVFEVRLPSPVLRAWQGSGICGAATGLWRSPSLLKSVLIGWINGFLPCGLSWMALLALASRGSIPGLVAGAYVFGLATMPGLLALGLIGRKLNLSHRRWLVRVGGVMLIGFGLLTIVRDHPVVHAWLHENLMWGDGKEHSGHHHEN
jgi:sulfite exporter TauE/SafE